MTNATVERPDAVVASHLLIHVAPGDEPHGAPSLLQRLQRRRRAHRPLSLEVHDGHGSRVLALGDAGALVDLAVPPGLYHVTSELAGTRRRYTVALEAGASFDLHLRPAGDGHDL